MFDGLINTSLREAMCSLLHESLNIIYGVRKVQQKIQKMRMIEVL